MKNKSFIIEDLKKVKLYDKSNASEDRDQLKAVIGICLTFGSLFLMGLYSNLL